MSCSEYPDMQHYSLSCRERLERGAMGPTVGHGEAGGRYIVYVWLPMSCCSWQKTLSNRCSSLVSAMRFCGLSPSSVIWRSRDVQIRRNRVLISRLRTTVVGLPVWVTLSVEPPGGEPSAPVDPAVVIGSGAGTSTAGGDGCLLCRTRRRGVVVGEAAVANTAPPSAGGSTADAGPLDGPANCRRSGRSDRCSAVGNSDRYWAVPAPPLGPASPVPGVREVAWRRLFFAEEGFPLAKSSES